MSILIMNKHGLLAESEADSDLYPDHSKLINDHVGRTDRVIEAAGRELLQLTEADESALREAVKRIESGHVEEVRGVTKAYVQAIERDNPSDEEPVKEVHSMVACNSCTAASAIARMAKVRLSGPARKTKQKMTTGPTAPKLPLIFL